MKKLLSFLLSLVVLAGIFSFTGAPAYAASSKYNAQKQQYNSQNSNVNFSGDKFAYFYYNGKQSELRYASSFSKKGTKLATSDYATNVTISGSYVYWNDYAQEALMRCKTDGSGKKKIIAYNSETQGLSYIISGKKIIYNLYTFDKETYDLKSNVLYTVSLNGKGRKKLASGVESNGFYTYKNKLYYIKKNKLVRYDLKTGKATALKKKMNETYLTGMEGYNLYYVTYTYDADYNTTESVYRFNVKTKKQKKVTSFVAEEAIYSTAVSGSRVFINTGTGAGNAFAQIKNGKPDYDSFRKKYELGGESLGFYKNYVIMEGLSLSKEGDYVHQGFLKMAKVQ